MTERAYCIVDCETTSLGDSAEIIEVCALRVSWPAFQLEGALYRRFQPEGAVSEEAARVNGYTPEAWARPGVETLSPRMCFRWSFLQAMFELTRGAQWVGSMPAFDHGLVERVRAAGEECRPFELLTHRMLDVGSLGAPLLLAVDPEGRGGQDALLDALAGLGLPAPEARARAFAESIGWPDRWGRHTAIGDAFGSLWLLEQLLPPAVNYWRMASVMDTSGQSPWPAHVSVGGFPAVIDRYVGWGPAGDQMRFFGRFPQSNIRSVGPFLTATEVIDALRARLKEGA